MDNICDYQKLPASSPGAMWMIHWLLDDRLAMRPPGSTYLLTYLPDYRQTKVGAILLRQLIGGPE